MNDSTVPENTLDMEDTEAVDIRFWQIACMFRAESKAV